MPRLAAAIAALTVLLSAATTHARQYCVLTLVGGRSVEGYVLSERDGQIELEVTFGSFTRTMTILDREIIERDCETRSGGAAPTPPAEEPDASPSPVATPDEPEDEPEADRVTYGALLVNVDGQIGGVFPDDFDTRDPTMLRADAIQEALNRFARRQADTPTGVQGMPKAIVLYVDSPGGYVAEEAAILELFDMYDERTEIVAIVKNAISAAAGITLAADRLYYLPDAAMGGMLAYTTEGVDLDDPVQQKFISIRVAKFKALAQKKDWNQDVIAAMVDPQGQDNDRVITLSGDEMEQLGERAIKVNSLEAALDDIATHYGVEIDTETFDRARRENTDRVNTSAKRVEKLLDDLIEDYQEAYDEIVDAIETGTREIDRGIERYNRRPNRSDARSVMRACNQLLSDIRGARSDFRSLRSKAERFRRRLESNALPRPNSLRFDPATGEPKLDRMEPVNPTELYSTALHFLVSLEVLKAIEEESAEFVENLDKDERSMEDYIEYLKE